MSKAYARLVLLFTFVGFGCGPTSGSREDSSEPSGRDNKGRGGNFGFGGFPDDLGSGNGGSGTPNSTGSRDPDEKVCAQQNFNLNPMPPEIMLTLDRSGSMRRDASNGRGQPDKWSQTTGALDAVLRETQPGVHWGLKMYPSWKKAGDDPCALTDAPVAPAVGQHSAVMTQILGNAPTLDNGATPTAKAVEEATAFLQKRTTPNPKFILLATDGIPNCRNNSDAQKDVPGAVEAVKAARAAGIAVFVVGIATAGVRVDDVDAHQVLNELAEAGGRARDDATKFYAANNEAELKAALGSIAAQAGNCTLTLNAMPPDPNNIAVLLDGKRVERGVDWELGTGNRSVVIKGPWCDKLKKGEIEKPAEVRFGCPGVVVL